MWFTYDYMGYLMYYTAFILRFDLFLDSGAEICQIFVGFLENLKKSKDILKLTNLYLGIWSFLWHQAKFKATVKDVGFSDWCVLRNQTLFSQKTTT